MKKRIRRRKCKSCHDLFMPDLRHLKRQKFCNKPGCKVASKKHSQQKWLDTPTNRDYFSGSEHVTRVQQWRQDNPRYWKRGKSSQKPPLIEDALQEMKSLQPLAIKASSDELIEIALQDLLSAKTLVAIGLNIHLNKNALQEIIDNTGQEIVKLTSDILKKLMEREVCQHGQTFFFNGIV